MIASLLLLYMRHGCVFPDRPSESEDGSRHTNGREPQHRPKLNGWPPAVMRRGIATPANAVARSIPLHVTVVQDTLTWNRSIPCKSISGCGDGGNTRCDLLVGPLVGPSGLAARPRPCEMRDDIDHGRDARHECEAMVQRLCVD